MNKYTSWVIGAVLAVCFMFVFMCPAYATCYGNNNNGCGGNGGNGGGNGDPTVTQEQEQNQTQQQQQQQQQTSTSSSTSNGGTGYGYGGSAAGNYTNVESNYQDRIQHTPIPMGQNCINGVCDATNTFYVTGGHDERGGNSINLGIAIPFGGSGDTTSGAMKAAHQRLVDNNRQIRERHQAEMAQLCMGLHQMITIAKVDGKQLSPELWERCYAYEHHFPDEKGPLPPHNGDWNPQQASPHIRNDKSANGGVDKYQHGKK